MVQKLGNVDSNNSKEEYIEHTQKSKMFASTNTLVKMHHVNSMINVNLDKMR